MPLKGRDTPADRPRNELKEEEETVQYSQVHHSGTANGYDGEFGSVEEDVDSSATGSLLKQFRQDQLSYISVERHVEVVSCDKVL